VTNLITPRALFSLIFLQAALMIMDQITYSRDKPIFIRNFPRRRASWIWFNWK